MNAKHFGVGRILGALLASFALSIPAFADRALPRPFDPEKIPMDNGWEETLVSEGSSAPCGKNLLYEGWERIYDEEGNHISNKEIIHVRDVKTNVVREAALPGSIPHFLGCTPDSRYLFIKRCDDDCMLAVFDTRSMLKTHSLPWNEPDEYRGQLLSPDGHHLVWYADEEVMLGGDWKLKTFRLPKDVALGGDYLAWSPDSRKVYVLSSHKYRLLTIYDVQTKKHDVVNLLFDLRVVDPSWINVHPETGGIYITGGFVDDNEHFIEKYLYSLDPAAIPKNRGKALKARTKRVGDIFVAFDFGPDNTIIFSMMYPSDTMGDIFPEEYNGIFVADLNGKILRRITKGTYDYAPYYWREQDTILFDRITKSDGGWTHKTISIKRKTKTPAH